MLALARYEAGICACGFHESLTSDRSNVFQPEFRTCTVCAGVERYARIQYDADDKRVGDNPPPEQPRPTDGRRLFVARLPQAEAERRRASREAPQRASGRGPGSPATPAQ